MEAGLIPWKTLGCSSSMQYAVKFLPFLLVLAMGTCLRSHDHAEPDAMRFPISLLTTVAIMDGVVESLVHKHHLEDILKSTTFSPARSGFSPCQRRPVARSDIGKNKHRKLLEAIAREEAEGVLSDIQALVGLTDVCHLVSHFV